VSGVVHRMGVFKELDLALGATSDEEKRLRLAVDAATSLVEHCCHAGFTVNDGGTLTTRASSDEVVRVANDLQQDLGEGPCLAVRRDQDTLVSPDLQHDDRWPRWGPRVHDELGAGSMISVLVHTDERSYGALSLYAARGVRFEPDDVAIAQTLAAHLAMVVAAGRESDQLGRAVHNRTIIGQAQGILMERLDVDAAQAFDYLRRVSSTSNRKLSDVAAEIARTRVLPDVAVHHG
jgi:GAF domain-containing protein